jgi:hypothetical protein
MNDMDHRLRESLERRAEDVPPRREVPSGLGGRAGRRIAVNSVLVGTAIVVVAAGLFAGVRAFTAPDEENLGGTPTPTATGAQQTQSSGSSGVSKCTAGRLRATGTFEGAAGSREGAVVLTNFSDSTCTLRGRPTITLLRSPGHPITSGARFLQTVAAWQSDDTTEPAGWPTVTLHPGDAASVRIRWGNWCPQGRAAPLWRVGIPGSGAVNVNGFDSDPPLCNGQSQPSTIEVGPFEPAPSN